MAERAPKTIAWDLDGTIGRFNAEKNTILLRWGIDAPGYMDRNPVVYKI